MEIARSRQPELTFRVCSASRPRGYARPSAFSSATRGVPRMLLRPALAISPQGTKGGKVISGKNTTPESLARSESGCLSFNFWEPSELCGRHRCGGVPGSTSATDPSATVGRLWAWRSGRSGRRYRFGGPSVGRSEPYPHSEAGGEQGGHHLGSKPSQLDRFDGYC